MSTRKLTSALGSNFVCAINRDRDGYQVPLALYEAGLLARFVTDFYAPDALVGRLPHALARRHIAGLPSAMTVSALSSFALQSMAQGLGLPMRKVFDRTDGMLARVAGKAAAKRGANLYCYAPYLPPEDLIPQGAVRAIFEYHPQPAYTWVTLREDHALFPQTAQSFQEERDALLTRNQRENWRRAEFVSCASSMTRRSLIHAGCEEDRITVVPYGFDTPFPYSEAPTVGRPRAAREFLFVGQGIQRKGLHHLIAAWQAAEPPDARLTLACYRIDPGIRAMIRSPRIRLLGRQGPEALKTLYEAADVFVMPSLIEGFGLVYLEALAHGCHIVATPNTGVPDLDLPSTVATLVDVGDVDALAKAIADLADAAAPRLPDRNVPRAAAGRRRWADFRAEIACHAHRALSA